MPKPAKKSVPEGLLQRGTLVPLDGSALAESALPSLEAFALRFNANVTLFHALEKRTRGKIHGERHLQTRSEAEDYLDQTARVLASKGIAVDWQVDNARDDDVATSIVAAAQRRSVGLILMCTHGSGGLRGMFFGSIAQQVLARQDRPILVVPPKAPKGPANANVHEVIVPLDSERLHKAALPMAAQVALAFKARLLLFLVVPTMKTLQGEQKLAARLMPSAAKAVLDLSEGDSEEYLRRLADPLREQGFTVDTEVVRGGAVNAVIEKAEQLPESLIVMATHGRVGVEAMLQGSVAPRVAGRATRPLLLVRAD
jgi:nucleotide-binding universal stress UspA family protein